MEELFSSYVFWVAVGIFLVLIVFLVFFFNRKKRKNEVVSDVKDFNYVPELDQVMKQNDVKPFSEQEFNRQLMSQVQGVDVNTLDNVASNSDNLNDINSVQEEVVDIVVDTPNLVPEFNQNVVQPQTSVNQISDTASDFIKQVQSNVQPQIQGAPEFIAQPNIFSQMPFVSNDVNNNSDVESIDVVETVQSDEVIDVVDTVQPQGVVSSDSVFSQPISGFNDQENISSSNV